MKLLISLTILAFQWSAIVCGPELIQFKELDQLPDIPDFHRSRDKTQYSVKVPTYNYIPNENRPYNSSPSDNRPIYNALPNIDKPSPNEDRTTTTQKPNSSFQPIKITHNDVVTGSNSVYGSQSLSNSGVIYAISQSQRSPNDPLVSVASPQPVLINFLSAEGTPKQASVQYIQLLKPLMMMPTQSYQQPKPMNEFIVPQTTPTTRVPTQAQQTPQMIPTMPSMVSYGSYSQHPLYTSQYPSYHNNLRPQEFHMHPQQMQIYHQSQQHPQQLNMHSQQWNMNDQQTNMNEQVKVQYQYQEQQQQRPQQQQDQQLSQAESLYDASQLNINEYMPGKSPIPLSPRSSASPLRFPYMQMSMNGQFNHQQYQPMAQRA